MEKNNQKNIEIFENAPVPSAVMKMAVPTVLSMIVTVLYNMVDAFFVGLTKDASKFAAVNIATPVFLFFMAAGNIYGMGGSSFLSRALGEKKFQKVKNISSFSFYAGLLTGIAGGIIMLTFMNPILNAIGTTETTFQYTKDYLSVISFGGPFVVLANAFTNIIRGEGESKKSMQGMMIGTVVNIILDPIFILDELFGIKLLGMGVKGAALATVIGNAVTISMYVIHILSKHSILSINIKDFKAKDGIMKQVLIIGLPASLTNILMSMSNILTNKLLSGYYFQEVTSPSLLPFITNFSNGVPVFADVPTAGMGVAMKANMLTIFVQLGIGMGISPLIGYNYGSRNFKRLKSILKFAIFLNILAGTLLTSVYFIFTKPIISIFSRDAAVVALGEIMLRALMVSTPVIGILFALNFAFQAMGKGIQSLILAVSRQGLIFFPLILILNRITGLYGIIYAQPVADIVSIIMAIIMFSKTAKELKTNSIPGAV